MSTKCAWDCLCRSPSKNVHGCVCLCASLCVYVYMNVSAWLSMSVSSMYVGGLCISVFSVHLWACACIWVPAFIYMCGWVYLCVCVSALSVYICGGLCEYICVCVFVYIHMCGHTYVSGCVTVCSCLCFPYCASSLYLSLRLDFLGSNW